MFAPWIPETLKDIEDLALGSPRPESLALTSARRIVVNLPPELPRPKVDLWRTPAGCGIDIDFGRMGGIIVRPDGSSFGGV